jgi:hypothetical protein
MLLACATLGMLGACGDDSATDAGTGAGAGGAAGTAGASGAAGGAGTAGKAGGGAGAVSCGGATCAVNATLKLIDPNAMACCSTNSKCGNKNGAGVCFENNAPGTPDTSCPDIPVKVTVAGTMMTSIQVGCCTPDKKCGGNYVGVGWGCIPRENAGADMGGPLMALACGTTGDSGAADAGL